MQLAGDRRRGRGQVRGGDDDAAALLQRLEVGARVEVLDKVVLAVELAVADVALVDGGYAALGHPVHALVAGEADALDDLAAEGAADRLAVGADGDGGDCR